MLLPSSNFTRACLCGWPLAGPGNLTFGKVPVLPIGKVVFSACGTEPYCTSFFCGSNMIYGGLLLSSWVWNFSNYGWLLAQVLCACVSSPLYEAWILRLKLASLDRNVSCVLFQFIARGISVSCMTSKGANFRSLHLISSRHHLIHHFSLLNLLCKLLM